MGHLIILVLSIVSFVGLFMMEVEKFSKRYQKEIGLLEIVIIGLLTPIMVIIQIWLGIVHIIKNR